mgnify:CR=1 FL=1
MLKVRIRAIAEAKGYNIRTFAAETGMSYPAAHALWHGRTTRIELDTLATLVRVLGVGPGELFVEESGDGAGDGPFVDMGANIRETLVREPVPAS